MFSRAKSTPEWKAAEDCSDDRKTAAIFCTISNEARPLTEGDGDLASTTQREAWPMTYQPHCGARCPRDNFQFAVYFENSRGVNSAGPCEIALRLFAVFPAVKAIVDVIPDVGRFDRGKILRNRLDASSSRKGRNYSRSSRTLREFSSRFVRGADHSDQYSRAAWRFWKFPDAREKSLRNQKPAASSSSCPGVRICRARVCAARFEFRAVLDREIVRQYSSSPSCFRRMMPMLSASFICKLFRYCLRGGNLSLIHFGRGHNFVGHHGREPDTLSSD